MAIESSENIGTRIYITVYGVRAMAGSTALEDGNTIVAYPSAAATLPTIANGAAFVVSVD